jgi:putative ABC transport system ATP-binding protein
MQIRAEHLTKIVPLKSGDTLTILEDVSLNIEIGEIISIVGVSGSGKSTLLGILAGLDRPTTGKVFWDMSRLDNLDEDKRAALRLNAAGFIFQNFELLASYTALENVLLPLELIGKAEAKSQAIESLEAVGLLDRLNHYPSQLSGGEQQRVAIARAFAIRPRVLFADEPTGSLDQKTSQQIINLLLELNEKYHTTLVCVTHDPALSEMASRSMHIVSGRLWDESQAAQF